MEHTKTPWTVNGNVISDEEITAHICSEWICNNNGTSPKQAKNWEANAAFIVKAVNEYDKDKENIKELVEALRYLTQSYQANVRDCDDRTPYLQAKQALAKAEAVE